METDILLVLSTVPDEEVARSIADKLAAEGMAACVSILPGLESHYRWQGKKESSKECLLMIKTLRTRYSGLESRLRELHPYDCPEIIAIPVEKGLEAYLSWVRASCGKI